ncbi:MAG: hypothetical protein KatS3mg110_3098 [Pirellulaceae bacterium]|nr:MAG: hypothetical protein KatS3mg110_3098 [Pirellulaceae bacterium]
MASNRNYPNKNTPLPDDAHLRRFLALAEPLLGLDVPLSESQWQLLRQYARQTGVSRDEFRVLVHGLWQRGRLRNLPPDGFWTPAGDTDNPAQAGSGAVFPEESSRLLERFLRDAQAVLALCQAGGEPATVRLAHMAHAMGLSEAEFDEALSKLGIGRTPEVPPGPAEKTAQRPPRCSFGRPADQFRNYLRQALAEKKTERGYLSASAARKMVAQGVEKLGLAEIYARHLVEELARQLELPMVEASCGEDGDPRLDAFFREATSIMVAQHGLTPQAMVLLEETARRLQLPDDQWRQALKRLGEYSSDRSRLDERLSAFSTHLDQILYGYRGKPLPPSEYEHLVWRGEQLYGVPVEEARRLIARRAAAADVLVLDHARSRQYMTARVDELLGGRTWLDPDTIQQLEQQAAHWGIPPEEVRRIVREVARKNRRERRLRRWLVAAGVFLITCLVLVLVTQPYWRSAALLVWSTGLSRVPEAGQPSGSQGSPKETQVVERPSADPVPTDTATATSGWLPLEVALVFAEVEREAGSELRVVLDAARSPDAVVRQTAYERIIDPAIEAASDEPVGALAKLVALLLVHDPDEAARESLLVGLQAAIGSPERNVPKGEPRWQFRNAVRILVDALGHTVAPHRTWLLARVNELFGTKLGASASQREAHRVLWASAVRRWADQVAYLSSDWSGEQIGRVWQSLEENIAVYLPDERPRLVLNLLLRALPAMGSDWRSVQPLIEQLTEEPARETLDALVPAVPTWRDDELKQFTLRRIVESLGGKVSADATVSELVLQVHRLLGYPERPVEPWRERRKRWLADIAGYRHVRTAPVHVPALCRAILDRSRWQLRGWALLAENEPLLKALSEEEDEELRFTPPERSVLREAYTVEEMPAVREVVRGIAQLRRLRRMYDRITLLHLIAEIAESAPDIPPQSAALLADYLVEIPSSVERESVQVVLNRLQHWNELKIGLAAKLVEQPMRTDQMAALLKALYGRDFTATDDRAWPRKVWQELVTEAIHAKASTTLADISTNPDPLARLQWRLAQHWRWRIELAGGEPADGTLTATEALDAAVTKKLDRLTARADVPAAIRERLDELARYREVVPLLASNDLEQAVRLDQIWVELVALELQLRHPGVPVSDYLESVRNHVGRNLLEQLYQLELTGLELVAILVEHTP